MNLDSFLGFLDSHAAWRDQKAQGDFCERISGRNLDTFFLTESLFRGIIMDFDNLDTDSGGRKDAVRYQVPLLR